MNPASSRGPVNGPWLQIKNETGLDILGIQLTFEFTDNVGKSNGRRAVKCASEQKPLLNGKAVTVSPSDITDSTFHKTEVKIGKVVEIHIKSSKNSVPLTVYDDNNHLSTSVTLIPYECETKEEIEYCKQFGPMFQIK